jgi:hypothetical protein
MQPKTIRSLFPAFMIILITALACNAPTGSGSGPDPAATSPAGSPAGGETPTLVPFTPTVAIAHVVVPAETVPDGKMVYDVESSGTAPEKRAPYGDSYDINRLERPFLQDMTYVQDLDIVTYTVAQDDNFWYVSIELIGTDPNNALGIHYGVELDLDHDGFGDYIVWAHPMYTPAWDTLPVQIFQDTNHDTGGLSGELSDAPITTDGYDKLIFNGGATDADPDMAWVRINAGFEATVQFAFKKSWAGTVFMLGVLSDGDPRDVGRLDYVDRYEEPEAGSPVKDKPYYPLQALFAVDNACREAFGFKPNGFEPQLCPREAPPKKTPHACEQPDYCVAPYFVWDQSTCTCSTYILF